MTSYTPRVRAVVRDIITADEKADISNDLISLATNKAYGRAAGTWQLMLVNRQEVKPGQNYMDLIETDDMLTIEMDAGNGAGWFPVMLGLVDRVSLVRQGGAVPVRQIKVSGQDYGKLLVKHDIAWDIMQYNEVVVKADDSGTEIKVMPSRIFTPEIQMGRPASVIDALMRVCVLDRIKAGFRFIVDTSKTDDDWKVWQPNLMSLQGCSAWSAMDRVSHRPYNILTTDTAQTDVKFFKVRLERYPIDSIGKLDSTYINTGNKSLHTIDDTEIVSDDLGVSDHERVNLLYYALTYYAAQLPITPDISLMLPQFMAKDTNSIKEHGLCLKSFRDDFVSPSIQSSGKDVAGQPAFAKDAEQRKNLFWEWFKRNHEYESGTITLHLRPDIRAGHGLLVKQGNKDEYKEYLIEQVAHQCVFHPVPQFTTTLHVTRGQEAPPGKAAQAGPPEPVYDP